MGWARANCVSLPHSAVTHRALTTDDPFFILRPATQPSRTDTHRCCRSVAPATLQEQRAAAAGVDKRVGSTSPDRSRAWSRLVNRDADELVSAS